MRVNSSHGIGYRTRYKLQGYSTNGTRTRKEEQIAPLVTAASACAVVSTLEAMPRSQAQLLLPRHRSFAARFCFRFSAPDWSGASQKRRTDASCSEPPSSTLAQPPCARQQCARESRADGAGCSTHSAVHGCHELPAQLSGRGASPTRCRGHTRDAIPVDVRRSIRGAHWRWQLHRERCSQSSRSGGLTFEAGVKVRTSPSTSTLSTSITSSAWRLMKALSVDASQVTVSEHEDEAVVLESGDEDCCWCCAKAEHTSGADSSISWAAIAFASRARCIARSRGWQVASAGASG